MMETKNVICQPHPLVRTLDLAFEAATPTVGTAADALWTDRRTRT